MSLVRTAMAELTQAVQAVRKATSPFIQQMCDAMDTYQELRDGGMSQEEATNGLKPLVRAIWPRRRPIPWRAECVHCEDTGWDRATCPDIPCGRENDPKVGPHEPHVYVWPCPCRPTNRTYLRALQRSRGGAEPPENDPITAAATASPRRRR